MSKNFYAIISTGGDESKIHIGKQTDGAFHTYNGIFFKTLREWQEFIENHADRIMDEYGTTYNKHEFIREELYNFDSKRQIHEIMNDSLYNNKHYSITHEKHNDGNIKPALFLSLNFF